MKNVFSFLIFFFCILLCVRAQDDRVVKGVVTDDTGFPIMGASVVIDGTAVGTSTDMDGEYSITVPDGGKALRITYMGMIPQLVELNGQTTVNVRLKEDVSLLDEVVVVAYGTQKKGNVTASVSVIDGEKLKDVTTPDVSNLLQSKAAGVQVVQRGGRPGEGASVRIRGASTLGGGLDPLWVVDGVIMHGTPSLDPNEISSISVLKDASATALYGSRGSNGVVVVTTKRAGEGKSQLTLSTRMGLTHFNTGNFELMDSQQLYDYYGKFANPQQIPNWFSEDVLKHNFDWFKNGTQTGLAQDHSLNFTAGTEKSNTFISASYYKETGAVKGYDYDRLSLRLNHDHKVTDRLTIKPKVAMNYRKNFNQEHSLYQMYLNMPWDTPYYEDGQVVNPRNTSRTWYGRDQGNYLYDLQWNYSRGSVFNIYTNFDLEFDITSDLKFISTNGYTLRYSDSKSYTDPLSNSGTAFNGSIRQTSSKRITRFTNQMLRYQRSFGNHYLNALVAYEYNDYVYEDMAATGQRIISGTEILNNTGRPSDVGGLKNDYALQSVLFNSEYNYDDRYLAHFSIRRDGASNFGRNNQYGTFMAASAGWNVHNEDFFNSNTINMLKLRASVGSVGNRPGALYPQYDLYSLTNTYNGLPVTTPSQIGNDNVTWEKSYQTNFAVDTRLFDRVSISLEYYIKNTSDLLYFVRVPDITGYSGYWENVGGVKNRGIEAVVDLDVIKHSEFNWNLNFNIGHNRNKITELLDGTDIERDYSKIFREGLDSNSWFMRKWLGVNPDNGKPLWEVMDPETGEKSETSDYNQATRQVVGTSTPDFFGGLTSTMSYKGISLSANFAFSKGGKAYNSSRELYDADGAYPTYNQQLLYKDWSRWEKPGDNATHPELVFGGNSESNKTSSRYLEDRSYLRLRNVQLAYSFPDDLLKNIGLSQAQVYLSGDNLFTWTRFTGTDPDSLDTDSNVPDGFYRTLYPVSRRLTFGLNLTF